MKKLMKLWAVWQFIEAAILLTAGILTIVFATNTDYHYIIGLIVGIFVIVDSALHLTMHFFDDEDRSAVKLVAIVAELTVGIILICLAQELVKYLTLFVAILLLAISLALILDGISRFVLKYKPVLAPILEFVAAAVFITAGVLLLISYANDSIIGSATVLIIIGISLSVLAIAEVIITIAMIHDGKKVKEIFAKDKKAE